MTKDLFINQKIDDYLQNDDEAKQLTRQSIEQLLDEWLAEFRLTQPTDYFLEHPTDDYELMCNIQTEKEFIISTLEIFGLPERYMEGNGHFPDWG